MLSSGSIFFEKNRIEIDFAFGLSREVFNQGEFWYYNQGIYTGSDEKMRMVKDIDIKTEVEKKELILLLYTEANLRLFSYNFIEELYSVYFSENYALEKEQTEEKVLAYIKKIKSSPDWFALMQKQAKERKVTLETVIRQNAEYMVLQDALK